MPTEMLTKDERTTPESTVASTPDPVLREWARRRVHRMHRLKLHVAAFVAVMAVLTPLWALVEWQDNGGFERFSDNSRPGDWEPWILYVALAWAMFLAVKAVHAYFDRPTTEADVERELRRLRAGR